MDKLKTEKINRKKKKEFVPTLDIRASGCLLSHYPQGVTDEAVNNMASGRGSCPLSIAQNDQTT